MEILAGAIIGFIIGAVSVFFLLDRSRRRVAEELSKTREALVRIEAAREAELKAADEKLALLEKAKANLQETFKALSAEALSRNNESFLKLAEENLKKHQTSAKNDLEKRQVAIGKVVEPVGQALERFNERIGNIEERRAKTDGALKEQLRQLDDAQKSLSQTTGNLVQALRAPQGRGRWGEMQLRRTVELAGMVNYCDFEEQVSVETDESQRQRPDLLIRLPNARQVVVDSKVPLSAYLEALEEKQPEVQIKLMKQHARHIRDHLKDLSTKAYWKQFENTPEFVVLFIPSEAIFSAALEQDPALIENGVDHKVILATPTTLIALLKAIAYGWQQDAIAREAKEIRALGKELYQRINVVLQHFAKLGKNLVQSVDSYNTTISSVETRLQVTARKFEALESISAEELPEIKAIEKHPTQPKEIAE